MSNAPLMPMATAVWLVENTTLTFKQIADFCKLHEVEIQGIADGEVAKGIKGYNPIISGQLSREEIELSSKDENRSLNIKSSDIEISNKNNLDFILVSPVLESHSSFPPLGWDKFSTLSKKSFSPTLALGGMKLIGNDFMNTINNNGFGLSGIRLY